MRAFQAPANEVKTHVQVMLPPLGTLKGIGVRRLPWPDEQSTCASSVFAAAVELPEELLVVPLLPPLPCPAIASVKPGALTT